MNFDPAEFGLIDDGSTNEVMIYNVQQGRIPETVEVFQEVFAKYRPRGFQVVFAAVDIANHRLIWIHRYDKGFDMKDRFYLGKYPKLVHCIWSGTRYNALVASAEESSAASAYGSMETVPSTLASKAQSLEELQGGPTVELKVYEVRSGEWRAFLHSWRKIVKLRRSAGFKIEFAFADIPSRRFIWGVSLDGDFKSENTNYLNSEDRIAANVISDFVEKFEIPKVVHIPIH